MVFLFVILGLGKIPFYNIDNDTLYNSYCNYYETHNSWNSNNECRSRVFFAK
jgi:hypothetical protein